MPRTGKDVREKSRSGRPGSVREDEVGESDRLDKVENTNKPSDTQVRIDQMLPPATTAATVSFTASLEDIVVAINTLGSRLESLASKDYIDQSLKKLVSADFVNKNLVELREDLTKQIKLELDKAHDHVRKVKEKLVESVGEIEDLKQNNTSIHMDLDGLSASHDKLVRKTQEMSDSILERDRRIRAQEKKH